MVRQFLCSSALLMPAASAMNPAEFQMKWGPAGKNITREVSPADIFSAAAEDGDPFSSLFDIIGKITQEWQQIVNAFKSEYSQQIVEKDFDNGWSMFKAATQVFKGSGLAFDDEAEFFANVKQIINLPDKYFADFDQQVQWIKFFDENTWAAHNTQFDIGQDGSDNQFTMYTKKRAGEDKLDVLFLTVNQAFHKADNYFVISQSKSILGGLFSKTEIKFKNVPAGLNEADMTFISDYFQMQAYQQIALASGGKAPVPPDPTLSSAIVV